MVTRRSQSSYRVEQPVRFYKFIALTFLVLTVILLGVVVFMSSKRAEIVITTKPSPVDITTKVVFGDPQSTHNIQSIVKKKVVTFEESFSPTGTKEEEGIATGVVTLHNETVSAQPLVATTRLLTSSGVLFRLKNRVTVPANGTLEDVEVYADEKGVASNIIATSFTIPGLNETKQKVIYATSIEPMTGGIKKIGALSEQDISRAEKNTEEKVKKQVAEEMSEQYPNLVGVFHVLDTSSNTQTTIGSEVDSFVLKTQVTIVSMLYDKTMLKDWIGLQLAKRAIDEGETVQASNDDPNVTFSDYNERNNTATFTVFHDGLVTLSTENRDLDKSDFFGKTKDEVRRYLLSLDHIHKVDVHFQPAWMRTVPHMHDHVSIVVKEVQ